MKALSGIERVWAGAKATRPEPSPPPRAGRHLALGGRIGEVVPCKASGTARALVEETVDTATHDRAATDIPVTCDGTCLPHSPHPA